LNLADWEPTLDDPIIVAYIRERVGEEGLPVAQLIKEKQPVQGVDILEIMSDQKASAVRKILYKLEDARVAEYMKDTDKTGWETFVWRLTLNEVKYQINKERHKMLKDFEHLLELEKENSFYQCENGHERVIFEDGLALEFRCPECGQPLNFVENEDRVGELENVIEKLKSLVF
jgi:transcription initiation factor TFIIE subunit alpha